jgi:hypothetical protein
VSLHVTTSTQLPCNIEVQGEDIVCRRGMWVFAIFGGVARAKSDIKSRKPDSKIA